MTVIAVNGAIDWLPRADYFFTLDPSAANLQRLTRQRPGVCYCAAVPKGLPLPAGVVRYLRRVCVSPEPAPAFTPLWWLWRWSAICGLTDKPMTINTGNSAWGALGLAYHLGAKKVALVGVDADEKPRIEGGQPNNLSHLPLLFESAMGQIDIINCGNMASRLPQHNINEGMQWLIN